MPVERLRLDLVELDRLIESLDTENTDEVLRLQALSERVRHEIDEQNGVADPGGLIDELEDVVSGFEGRHPVLSAHLNNLIVLLGSIGI